MPKKSYDGWGFSFRQELQSDAYSPLSATSSSCVPELGDLAVDDDADPVGVVGRVQTVRDRHDRSSTQNRDEGPLEVTGRTRVQHRGRLVEHEGVRVAQDESREGDLLGLRGGDLVAGRAEFGEHPVGQGPHPFEGVDGVERAHDLVVARLGLGERQVLANACR